MAFWPKTRAEAGDSLMAVSDERTSGRAWLSDAQLAALADMATRAPDLFEGECAQLDALRRAQVRRFVHETTHGKVDVLGSDRTERRESNSVRDPSNVAAVNEPELVLDRATRQEELDETTPSSEHADDDGGAVEGSLPEPSESAGDETAPDDSSAADDPEDASLGDVSSLDDLMATTPDTGDEVMSLDDLFAEPAPDDGSSASLDDLFATDDTGSDDAMSLDDLFGGDDSGGDMSLDDLLSMDSPQAVDLEAPAEEAEEDAGADYPVPTEYGVPLHLEMSAEDICDIVRPLPLYAGIAEDDLLEICKKMVGLQYAPGSLLCRDGDEGDVMWLVRHGGIRVLPQGKDLDIVKPAGEIVGEMSLLDGAARSATLVCEGDTELLQFSLDAWTATFRDAPEAGLAFLRNLARMQQDEMRSTTEKAVAEAAAKAAIESEVKQAEETQKLALPDGMPDYFGEDDCAVIYTGARGVSGDYYDFIEFEDDPDRIIVIFADSTGHGLNAGLLMLLARSAAHTQSRVDPSVSAITRAINDVICEVFGATLFMTYVCMLFDRNAKTIEYTNAGQQSHPYLYRMASGEFDPLASQTFQLGIQAGAAYTSEIMSYEPGDLLVCYSDGIIEAPYCPPGADDVDRTQEFGDDRIEALIVKTSEMKPQDVIDELQKQAREWCVFFDGHVTLNGVEHDGDDITNLVVRMR
jgi:serine phosphatase RsbU (regulator of sigma subunit)